MKKILLLMLLHHICLLNIYALEHTPDSISNICDINISPTIINQNHDLNIDSLESIVFINSINHTLTEQQDLYAPNNNAIEIIEKRTETSKYYVDKDTAEKIYVVASIGALHYKKDGQWTTIDERLHNKGNGIYEASNQEEPVGFNCNTKTAYIKTIQETVHFNNWSLNGITNGKETVLSTANWTDYKVTSEKIYIKNIFPGIDAEMIAGRSSIKTNFIVHNNEFPHASSFIFKDTFSSNAGSFTNAENAKTAYYTSGSATSLFINSAVAYEKSDLENSTLYLPYSITENTLSLTVDTGYINTHLQNGDVIIDPLVTTTNSIATEQITGSRNCGSTSTACKYNMMVPFPAETTMTGVYEKFAMSTVGSIARKYIMYAVVSESHVVHFMADWREPETYETPGAFGSVSYMDITEFFARSMPEPSCTSYDIPFSLRMYNTVCIDSDNSLCSEKYQKAIRPFVIMLEGRKITRQYVSRSFSVCNGEPATIAAKAGYGVPPYSYAWDNGAGTSRQTTVIPTSTTNYIVTITDQCNNSVYDTINVHVKPYYKPQTPIASSNSPICEGETLQLSASTIPNVTYQWVGINNFFSNNQNPTLSNPNENATGIYTVRVVSKDNCWSFRDTIDVTVNNKDAAIGITVQKEISCNGATLLFTAIPTDGGTAPSYKWKVNGINVGNDTSIYSSTALVPGDTVSCEMVSNAGGCISSDTVVSNIIVIENLPNDQIRDIDGNLYNTITLGKQTWLKENLKTTHFNDGTPIPHIKDDIAWIQRTEAAYCNWKNIADYHEINNHGRLYNWYAVATQKLCPSGWHVPKVSEWTVLLKYLSNNGYSLPSKYNNKIGKAMAATTGWHEVTDTDPNSYWTSGDGDEVGFNQGLNNSSGFSIVPTGTRFKSFWTSGFKGDNTDAAIWAADSSITCMLLHAISDKGLYSYPVAKYYGAYSGLSVRCIKDDPLAGEIPITLYAETKTVCAGDSVTLTTLVCDGTPPFIYEWNVGGYSDSIITIYPQMPDTMYTVTVTDANNDKGIDTIFISIVEASYYDTTVTACDSFLLNDIQYTQSGIYTQTFSNSAGCDSIVTLYLTLGETTTRGIYPTVCDTYTLNGQNYTQSGIYTQTLTNVAGCDSIINIYLEILDAKDATYEITDSVCNSYTLNGETYTESGDYTQKWRTVAGCDSTIIIHLTVLATADTLDVETCGEYTLNGQTYTQSGTYTQTLVNTAGCDSILTINLSLSESRPERFFSETVCKYYLFYGTTLTESGVYQQTVPSDSGCDSTIILYLDVLQSYSETTATICEGESYEFNDTSYTTTGNYYHSLSNQYGCDSTAILHLHVEKSDSTVSKIFICEGESYWFNHKEYSETGRYTSHHTSSSGCDSISTIILNIIPTSTYTTEAITGIDEGYEFKDSTYYTSGIYTFHYYNSNGCDSSVILDLRVVDYDKVPNTLYVPNAFAPNNAAPEVAIFKPKGLNLSLYKIWIYDTWGNLVWYSNKLTENGSPAEAWDGRVNSQLHASGCYIWKIDAKFKNGSSQTKSGTVILIR